MILVIDIGTSSMRSIVYEDGRNLITVQKEYGLDVVDEYTVEQDANIVLDSIGETLIEIGRWIKKNNRGVIEAISVTAQRSSVILVDERGVPIHKAMMWQDTRAKYICEDLKDEWKRIYSICGMKPTPVFSAPKIRYIKDKFPEIYEKAYKVLGFQELVLHYLTDRFVTDTSIASRTCLFDIRKQEWSQELMEIFGLEQNKLCDYVPVSSVVDVAKKEIQDILSCDSPIPVITAGGDQQCAALGLGLYEEGDAIINSGTGSYILALSDEPIFDDEMRITCNISVIPDKWMIEGSVLGSGKAVDWTKHEFFHNDISEFQKACDESSVGANGVIYTPTFIGTGTPSWNASARAGIYNLGLYNTKNDFARAVLEGISAQLHTCIEIIQECLGKEIKTLRISGGLTKNKVYNQILADISNREVDKFNDNESTALGAYISARVALDEAISYKECMEKYLDNSEIKRFKPKIENYYKYLEIDKLRKKFDSLSN